LFFKGFSLAEISAEFQRLKENGQPSSLLLDATCTEEEVRKTGILEVEEEGKVLARKVVSFVEKPSPDETKSRLQCPCFYLLHQSHLKYLNEFLDERENAPLETR